MTTRVTAESQTPDGVHRFELNDTASAKEQHQPHQSRTNAFPKCSSVINYSNHSIVWLATIG